MLHAAPSRCIAYRGGLPADAVRGPISENCSVRVGTSQCSPSGPPYVPAKISRASSSSGSIQSIVFRTHPSLSYCSCYLPAVLSITYAVPKPLFPGSSVPHLSLSLVFAHVILRFWYHGMKRDNCSEIFPACTCVKPCLPTEMRRGGMRRFGTWRVG